MFQERILIFFDVDGVVSADWQNALAEARRKMTNTSPGFILYWLGKDAPKMLLGSKTSIINGSYMARDVMVVLLFLSFPSKIWW
jgi:hypothetical protein